MDKYKFMAQKQAKTNIQKTTEKEKKKENSKDNSKTKDQNKVEKETKGAKDSKANHNKTLSSDKNTNNKAYPKVQQNEAPKKINQVENTLKKEKQKQNDISSMRK